MRIAFLTSQVNLKTGGGSNLSPHLKATSMAELGHDVTMFTFFPEKNSFIELPPYSVLELPTRFKNWFALQIKIFFILKKYEKDFDVFAFEGEHFIWGAGFYRALGSRPVLMHFNGPIFSIYEHGVTYNAEHKRDKSLRTRISEGLRKLFEKNIGVYLANKIDAFTSDSPIIKEWHREFGIDSEKITVMPAFVDLEKFSKEPIVNIKNNKTNNKINILYVGRLVAEKGVDTLIMAIKDLKNRQNLSVRIVGRGPETERLIKMSEHYKINNTVIFYPWSDKDTLNELYHSADIFVHPARWAEPLGLTVIEAMAAGLPVIIPKISGSSWAAGEGGLTFKNGDYNDLKDKIELLCSDKKLREILGTKAKMRSLDFDYRRNIKKLEEILSNIIHKQKGSSAQKPNL